MNDEEMIVLSIVVNKKERYLRLENRQIRPLTNIEATKRDITEIENLAKGGPIAYADYYIFNNNRQMNEPSFSEVLKIINEFGQR